MVKKNKRRNKRNYEKSALNNKLREKVKFHWFGYAKRKEEINKVGRQGERPRNGWNSARSWEIWRNRFKEIDLGLKWLEGSDVSY